MSADESAQLSELSRQLAVRLFSTFPEWEQFSRAIPDSDGRTLEVAIPQQGTERSLLITTVDDEITIGFDAWHTHEGPFGNMSIEETVANAMEVIDSFVAEETVVGVWFRDGQWIRSDLSSASRPERPFQTRPGKSFPGREPTIESSRTPIHPELD